MAIAKDASSPAVKWGTLQSGTGSNYTLASDSFSPPANSLVAVMALSGYYGYVNFTVTGLTCKDSLNNSLAEGVAQPCTANYSYGAGVIFWRYYASAPGSITVSVTLAQAQTDAQGYCLDFLPVVLTGCASDQSGAGSAHTQSTTQANVSCSSTSASSWCMVAAGGYQTGTITGTGLAATWASNGNDAVGNYGEFGYAAPGATGAHTMGWTSSDASGTGVPVLALEILPSSATAKSDTEAPRVTESVTLIRATLTSPETARGTEAQSTEGGPKFDSEAAQAAEAAITRATLTSPETARVTEAGSAVAGGNSAYVQKVFSGTCTTSGNDLIMTVDGGVTTTPGNVVILWVRNASGRYLTGVVDSRGNSWQVDSSGSHTLSTGGMASAVMGDSTYLRASDTITATFSSTATTGKQAGAAEFSGLDTSGGYTTVQTTNVYHASASPNSVTTSSAGGAGDLVVSSVAASTASTNNITASDASSGGTWTQIDAPTQTANANGAYQIAAGTSAYTAEWTFSGNADIIATVYKAAPQAGLASSFESALATEASMLRALLSATEAALASEAQSLGTVAKSDTDAARAADAAVLRATLVSSDSAVTAEAQAVSGPSPSDSDSVQASEIFATAAGPRTDTEAARVTDTGSAAPEGVVYRDSTDSVRATEALDIAAGPRTDTEAFRAAEAQAVNTGAAPSAAEAIQLTETFATGAGPRTDTEAAVVTDLQTPPTPRLYSLIRTYVRG